jgi:glycosyltransferase involved in cell wall biosynthesis
LQLNKTKIIFSVTNDLSYDQRMQRICSSLAANNIDVELVGRNLPHSKPLNMTYNFKQTRLSCRFNKGKLFYLEYNIRLLFYLLKQQATAFCAIDLDTLFASGMANIFKQNTLIFDAHEHFTEVPEVTNRKITQWIWNTIGKIFIPRAKLCYTVGPQLANMLGEIYENKFEVIMNVPVLVNEVNLVDKVDRLSDKNNSHIFYQGALNESRGLEQAILAMHQVENIQLWLAGEGDLSQQLRDLVAKEKLENKVIFLGFIKPENLKELTANAKIGLNLLEPNGLSYYYSLANKYFDYLQAGVPCICANFPEYIAINNKYHCNVLVDCNVDLIANTINELLQNKILYDELKTNSLQASKNYNWNIEEQKLVNLYNRLFNK